MIMTREQIKSALGGMGLGLSDLMALLENDTTQEGTISLNTLSGFLRVGGEPNSLSYEKVEWITRVLVGMGVQVGAANWVSVPQDALRLSKAKVKG